MYTVSLALQFDSDKKENLVFELTLPIIFETTYNSQCYRCHHAYFSGSNVHIIYFTDPNCVSIKNGCFLADPFCER